MNVLNDTWRGLVQRRLWPVALLLVGAAAAMPFLLAKDSDPVTPAAAPAPAGGEAVDAQPIVAVASTASREAGRDVVGSAKDPFRPAIAAKKGKPAETATSSSGGAATPAGSDAGGSTGGGLTIDPGTTGGIGVTPRKVYEVNTVAVRFGPSDSDDRPVKNLRRLKALPSVSDPVLVYLGILRDKKTAVFMVDGGSVVQGDGECRPSADNCQTLQLRVGETEFIDVANADGTVVQYQVDVIKIRRARTTSAAAASQAYKARAAGGRQVLKQNLGRVGRYRYDEATGQLRIIGDAEYRRSLRKAAKKSARRARAAAAAAAAG